MDSQPTHKDLCREVERILFVLKNMWDDFGRLPTFLDLQKRAVDLKSQLYGISFYGEDEGANLATNVTQLLSDCTNLENIKSERFVRNFNRSYDAKKISDTPSCISPLL